MSLSVRAEWWLMLAQSGRRGGFRLGGLRKRNLQEDLAASVKLAKESDFTVLVVGTNAEWESESYDRTDIKLVFFTLSKRAAYCPSQVAQRDRRAHHSRPSCHPKCYCCQPIRHACRNALDL